MKKVIIIALAIAAIGGAQAQVSAFKQGNSASVEGYTLPRTVVTVTVKQEREVTVRGPFARYASQYLGIATAPQNDKESYRLVSATLGFYEEPDPRQTYLFDEKAGSPIKIFNWLSIHTPQQGAVESQKGKFDTAVPFADMSVTPISDLKLNSYDKSPEQMAADAAEVIFRIRKKRIEVVTGETGEGVFGEGLKTALDEMQRLEDEYTSLFIGKRFVETSTKVYFVVPEANTSRVTVCRFSDSKGIVADSDASGRPINLELTPEKAEARADQQVKRGTRSVTYRVPVVENCRVTDGQNILTTLRIPVFQAGGLVDVPVVFGM